jgi:hypothetical protein
MTLNTEPRSYRKLWLSLCGVIAFSFLVLGYFGSEIYRQAPPLPKRVVATDGTVLFTGQQIKDGQNVWQSMGGAGGRHHLGAWRLCRARLERGLAAPRSDLAAGLLGRSGRVQGLRPGGPRDPGHAPPTPEEGNPFQHLPAGDR